MKNILVNPKVSINKKRKEVNDVIDQALVNWLIKNFIIQSSFQIKT